MNYRLLYGTYISTVNWESQLQKGSNSVVLADRKKTSPLIVPQPFGQSK